MDKCRSASVDYSVDYGSDITSVLNKKSCSQVELIIVDQSQNGPVDQPNVSITLI